MNEFLGELVGIPEMHQTRITIVYNTGESHEKKPMKRMEDTLIGHMENVSVRIKIGM